MAGAGCIGLRASAGLEPWLAAEGISLAFTTYRANRLLLLGRAEAGGLRLHERLFDRPMGLFAEADSLWMVARNQIWRLDNHLPPGLQHEGGDRLYVPAQCSVTGDVNGHELVVPKAGEWAAQPLFVNTAFSCLARLERGCSFAPIWRPDFLARLAPDDACHLNGVALQAGEPTWATACGHQAGASSWRNDRRRGGVVLHIPTHEPVATGLSMPHSPRWHMERLWLLNSGSGELGWIEHGRFQPLCALPGFTRGLAFSGGCAVVGLSKLRSPQFTGLALDERLPAEGHPAGCCGLRVVELASGEILHSLDLPEPIDELFDVAVLPGVRQPRALGLRGEEIDCLVTLPGEEGQMRVRPLAPSGRPHQGPVLQPFGLPAPITMAGPEVEVEPLFEQPIPSGVVPITYQRVFHLTTENLAPYASLTSPSLATGGPALGRIRGELLGLSAMAGGVMVGLAIAERLAGMEARLLSLMVDPSWRRRGIGTALLGWLMDFLAREAIGRVRVRYEATLLAASAFERMLMRLGWRAPQMERLLLEGRSADLARLDWLDHHPVQPPWRLQAWGELTEVQRMELEGVVAAVGRLPRTAAAVGSPDPMLSLALLHHNDPVGALLLHRIDPTCVWYSNLVVAPAHRSRAQGPALLCAGFRRQHAAGVPIARAILTGEDAPLLRLLRRPLESRLLVSRETRSSWVDLPGHPAPPLA